MLYTDKTTIEGYLGTTLDNSLSTFITLTINGISDFIEKYCGDEKNGKRIFSGPALAEGEVEVNQTRYFDGNGQTILPIGDLVELESLTVDGTLQVEEEDFYLKPYNAILEGKPYTEIQLIQPSGRGNSRLGTIYEFEEDQRNIKVVGKFRYSNTVPSDIKLIATKLVAETLKERVGDEALREIKAETFDDYKVEFIDIAKTAKDLGVFSILDQYKRKTKTTSVGSVQI